MAEQFFLDGNRHLATHDYPGAAACFRQAVSIAPLLGEAHANLGWVLARMDACVEADACFRRALELNPGQVQIHLNHGAFLAALKRFGAAEAIYSRAIAIDGSSAAAWSNLGVLYTQMARFDAAEDCCRTSLSIDPDYANARINLAYLCLRLGRLEEGWALYEARTWQYAPGDGAGCPRWAGESLHGKSLLIGPEGGYGDMIQFCRYAAELKRRGARRITLVCAPPLLELFASLDGVDELLSSEAPLAPSGWDFWTSVMSLPYHCETRVDSIPARLPYLQASTAEAAKWRQALPDEGVRIGLAWKGRPQFENDNERSLPMLDILDPLAAIEGATFVSLQQGAATEDLARSKLGAHLVPSCATARNFADTAAIVTNLDLVICVDTAVAHLAGALGKPCWILLPHHMADWRWLAGRTDSPWYPGAVRLFRQTARGDWSSVVTEVRVALEEFVRANAVSD